MTIRLGFSLVSGPDNIREFQEADSQTYQAGDLVQLDATGYIAQFTTVSGSSAISDGIIGVAASDADNVTTKPYKSVYVITPEQTWKVHAAQGVKPTDTHYDIGLNVKATYSYSASYTLSNGTTTNTTAVGAWVAGTTAAATAGKGLIIVGYDPRAGDRKGGNMLVRFGSTACLGRTGL